MKAGFRPEIQALRALAVLLVILFHLWPARLTGGYVGVDVFFVISGYLITSHLLREADLTGRVKLSEFYARRIRRLLPAALGVLLVTLVAVIVFVPASLWQQFMTEIGASALYAVNWLLAFNAVDYFGAENLASPVQHYWSLSAEEQFYLVWPLLIIAVYVFGKRLSPRGRHRLLAAVFGLVLVFGLSWSIIGAEVAQAFTYFATPAHAWEFAAGGLVAVAAAMRLTVVDRFLALGAAPVLRALAGWLGLALIAVSAVVFDGATKFPGWVAILPVGATVLVIVAGLAPSRLSPGWLVRSRPVQFVGDVSYSAYLWHWPLIVIAPFAIDRDLSGVERIVLLVATFVLAWGSKVWLEDSVRVAPFWKPRSRVYAAAAVVSSLVVVGCMVPVAIRTAGNAAVQSYVNSQIDSGDDCFAARALVEGGACQYLHTVDPAVGTDPRQYTYGAPDSVCSYVIPDVVRDCVWGSADPDFTVALIGDSHMGHYTPAFSAMLATNDWQFHSIIHNACPALVTEWTRSEQGIGGDSEACRTWRDAMIDYIAESTDIDVVVVSNYTQKFSQIETAGNRAEMAAGFAATWKAWTDAGIPVVVIADDPLTNKQNVPACVSAHLDDPTECSLPRDEAVGNDPLVAAATDYPNPLVTLVDLTDSYCDAERCYVVAGGVVVYSDTHHLSTAFSRSLWRYIEPRIVAALDLPRPSPLPTASAVS